MAFTVEDFARAALIRFLPRSRYRLAAQSDSRFQSFASNTARIAYRQQGATPALLLFSGPGQDAGAAATAAAAWAEANWRPNAVQRKVGTRHPADDVAVGLVAIKDLGPQTLVQPDSREHQSRCPCRHMIEQGPESRLGIWLRHHQTEL